MRDREGPWRDRGGTVRDREGPWRDPRKRKMEVSTRMRNMKVNTI